ncbi:MAG: hypothetical protein WA594_00755 [Candidatus Sulfotelmatobacter sp.]
MDQNRWVLSSNPDKDDKKLGISPHPRSLSKAKRVVRERMGSDVSLADELIAERREEARWEN